MAKFDLKAVQAALAELGVDGWLFYDFRRSNVLARRILNVADDAVTTRRFFYFVPVEGEPVKIVHAIETGALDHLPGERRVYLRWQSLEELIGQVARPGLRLAMEYSPRCAIPYISRVDAGVIELVRSFGAEPVSSGDLVQLFEAVWDDGAWQSHQTASQRLLAAFDAAWSFIGDAVRGGKAIRETEVQGFLMDRFAESGLTTDHAPIVAVGPHSGDPHFAPGKIGDAELKPGEFILIDAWAKLDEPNAMFADYTRVAFLGEEVPEKIARVFQAVADGRDAAIELVRRAFQSDEALCGWQVDQAARDVIERAGFGDHFTHRTGHNIGRETHGNGANMDNLETRDERRVMRRTCFSIEPGVYLEAFGVRSEVNVFVDAEGEVHVTGGPLQREVMRIPTR
jgi:Xaa-Pro aminopeptidase